MRTFALWVLVLVACVCIGCAEPVQAAPPDAKATDAPREQHAEAAKANACEVNSGEKLKAVVASGALDQVGQVAAYPSSPIAPADADYSVALDRAYAPGEGKKIAFYRVLVDAENTPKMVDRVGIVARPIPETAWQVTAKIVPQGATELTIGLPKLRGWFFHSATLSIIGCSAERTPLFVSSFAARVSDGATFEIVCAAILIGLYLLAGYSCRTIEGPIKKKGYGISWGKYLDPVVISSGPNGKGSISRFQILIFSIVVFYVLLYSFLRLGSLSDMSVTVLELLGISAVGAAAAKVTDNSRNRLSWENWTWLINAGWLPKNGLAAITEAKWADLITADDGVDVYHFQMLIFSFVVVLALLMTGLYGLSTFKIPDTLLALLGLSQAVYVGGKIVAQPSCGDLDKGLKDLRDLEDAYHKKIAALDGARWGTLEQARKIDEYVSLEKQYNKVRPMFESVMGNRCASIKAFPSFGPADTVVVWVGGDATDQTSEIQTFRAFGMRCVTAGMDQKTIEGINARYWDAFAIVLDMRTRADNAEGYAWLSKLTRAVPVVIYSSAKAGDTEQDAKQKRAAGLARDSLALFRLVTATSG